MKRKMEEGVEMRCFELEVNEWNLLEGQIE